MTFEQIALPNINKYLLNGRRAQQQEIHAFFQGVGLNINNPTFVIMQGRITKVRFSSIYAQSANIMQVLNMRPQEILGMIEEAAGTRMFEERKDKARKTIAKKDKKVQEINATLTEEVAPKLEKLRKEKRSYLEWQKACTDLERIGRVLRAWEWTEAKQRIESKKEEMETSKSRVKEVKTAKQKAQQEAQAAEKQAADVIKKRDEEMRKGGKLSKLEAQVAELDKELVKIQTQIDIKKTSIKDEEGRMTNAKDELREVGFFSLSVKLICGRARLTWPPNGKKWTRFSRRIQSSKKPMTSYPPNWHPTTISCKLF